MINGAEWAVITTDCDELFQGRLNIAGLVSAAALKHCRCAVPHPRKVEPDGADRLWQAINPRGIPRLARIYRDIDGLHPAAARPSQTIDIVKSGAGKLHLPRGEGDDRLCLHF